MSKKSKPITSKDGYKAVIHYTEVTNGADEIVMRYFAVPLEITDQPFIPGFISRDEAVEWWEKSVVNTTYVQEEQCKQTLKTIQTQSTETREL